MLSFRMKRTRGFHYLAEVISARSSRWPTMFDCRDHVVTLALAIFWLGGLGIVLLVLLMRPVVVLGGHCVFLVGVLIGHVEELLYCLWLLPRHLLEKVRVPGSFSE